jgi:hypothetical protein
MSAAYGCGFSKYLTELTAQRGRCDAKSDFCVDVEDRLGIFNITAFEFFCFNEA